MFGWDYDKQESMPSGGILGKLEAFYSSSEFTERGILHGHFLSWLLRGLNPSEVHQKMCDDHNFQERFFAFFEDTIRHHLPDIDLEVEKSFEPQTERPLKPPNINSLDMCQGHSHPKLSVAQGAGSKPSADEIQPTARRYPTTGNTPVWFPGH